MDIGERSGRHRLHDEATIWLPVGGSEYPPRGHGVAPPPLPPQRTRDPYVDTDAVGLRKFNIGLVPASVTPPRTWKRAAWFAVLSSVAVLVGLTIAAAKLVGSSNPVERVGMPGYPTDMPLLTGFSGSKPPPTPTSSPSMSGSRGTSHVERPDGLRAPADADRPAEGGSSSTGRTTSASSRPSPSPEVVTVPVDARPVVDAEEIAVRTESFYEQVATTAGTALALVSDSFRPNAEALLEERFADVSLIEVTGISVDPAKGVTTSTLRVTRKDGSTSTEKRELVFTTTGAPLINAERPAPGA